ncbi:MAG: hypothetical protein CMO81_06020 [Waddliaceae bacterium]|nr:hypothetical protein [Waddliaceae bacterium]
MYVYVCPILNGKSQELETDLQNLCNRETSESKHTEARMNTWKKTGFSTFETWIQNLEEKSYLISMLELENWSLAMEKLEERIADQDPYALEIQKRYIDFCGIDFGKVAHELDVELILDETFLQSDEKAKYRRAFAYPLMDGMDIVHKEFTNARKEGPLRKELEKWMETFQMKRHMKWIQRSPWGTFLTFYQEYNASEEEIIRDKDLCPSWSTLHNALMEHTGLSTEQLMVNMHEVFAHPLLAPSTV